MSRIFNDFKKLKMTREDIKKYILSKPYNRLMNEYNLNNKIEEYAELLQYAQEQVKNNAVLPLVSQQRELLLAYENFKQQPHHDGAFNADEFIEMFLSQ